MKGVAIILLFMIAGGVTYLLYSEYQKRRIAQDIAERIRDPDGYVVKEWAERAKLKCDMYRDIELIDTKGGFKRPISFSCVSFRTGTWKVVDRECTEEEMDLSPGQYDRSAKVAKGYPEELGQLYKPIHVVCWEIQSEREE